MPSKKNIIPRPDRPRLRRWIDPKKQYWLVMEPAKVAWVGGAVCATLAMAYLFLRQQLGMVMDPGHVLVRVGIVFVVSYALTGLFMSYLLWVAEKELSAKAQEREPAPPPAPQEETPEDETEEESQEQEPGGV